MATAFAHQIREAELAEALPLLPGGARILELGAGDGWQANELARAGFQVTAVDVGPPSSDVQHFPVSRYDGRSLPFEAGSFDAIYSSNVLEHVADFGAIQREVARVLRPGGHAVHCVPSAGWRFWTTAGHPLYAARWALRLSGMSALPKTAAAGAALARASGDGFAKLLWLGLVPQRHGEHGNALTEVRLFSRSGWNRRFRETGWDVVRVAATRLFYTGNELFGIGLGNAARRRLAAAFGSSTWIYVLRPAG
jgi:SAM-dependent methyltransferase